MSNNERELSQQKNIKFSLTTVDTGSNNCLNRQCRTFVRNIFNCQDIYLITVYIIKHNCHKIFMIKYG